MVFKAKPGYEDLYEAVVAKQAKLDAEKASKIEEANKAIESEFAEKTQELANLFAQVSIAEEETVIEETPAASEETVAVAETEVAG